MGARLPEVEEVRIRKGNLDTESVGIEIDIFREPNLERKWRNGLHQVARDVMIFVRSNGSGQKVSRLKIN